MRTDKRIKLRSYKATSAHTKYYSVGKGSINYKTIERMERIARVSQRHNNSATATITVVLTIRS